MNRAEYSPELSHNCSFIHPDTLQLFPPTSVAPGCDRPAKLMNVRTSKILRIVVAPLLDQGNDIVFLKMALVGYVSHMKVAPAPESFETGNCAGSIRSWKMESGNANV